MDSNIEKDKHDAGHYDADCYKREIDNANLLYDSYLKTMKSGHWKPDQIKTEMQFLSVISNLSNELQEHRYIPDNANEFVISERGKVRVITSETTRDKIVGHHLCDFFINPAIENKLIYNNGASREGKGTSFARENLLKHLRRFYNKNHSNDGYILLFDYSKFYDNLLHGYLIKELEKYVENSVIEVVKAKLARAEIDVSYMTDEEIESVINGIYNSLDYVYIDKSMLTKKKTVAKHMNIGDQLSQSAGVFYPNKIDKYVTIVRGIGLYGRFMDDGYIIHKSKEELEDILEELYKISSEIGLHLNKKKTRICSLDSNWTFLKIHYSLLDTGKVMIKMDSKTLKRAMTRNRNVAKHISRREFEEYYRTWFNSNYKYMSKNQRERCDIEIMKIKEENYESEDCA